MLRKDIVGLTFVTLMATVSCSDSDFHQPVPAADEPTTVPGELDEGMVVNLADGTVELSAPRLCFRTLLWAQSGERSEWRDFAIDGVLVDVNGRAASGVKVFCSYGGNEEQWSATIPIDSLPTGWYTVCNAAIDSDDRCSSPFQLEL